MKVPLILVDGYDVMMFSGKEQLEDFVEPWQLHDPSGTTGFDSVGKKLRFSLSKSGKVVVDYDGTDAKEYSQELRKHLAQYLGHVGVGEHLYRTSSLETLAVMASQYAKVT